MISLGRNNKGQLCFDSQIYQSYKPLLIKKLQNIVSISAGSEHSLFLSNEGIVYVCGSNEFGQLGLTHNSKFVYIPTRNNFIEVATKIVATQFASFILLSN